MTTTPPGNMNMGGFGSTGISGFGHSHVAAGGFGAQRPAGPQEMGIDALSGQVFISSPTTGRAREAFEL